MSVEFVDIEGWDAVMLRHRLWAKTYWHIWEHIEHHAEMECRHAADAITHAMSYHLQEAS